MKTQLNSLSLSLVTILLSIILKSNIGLAQCTLNVTGYTMTVCDSCPWNISVPVTGGTSPYTYLWSTGTTVPGFTTCTPGVYTLTVTDANACTDTAVINLVQLPPLNISLEIHNPTCQGFCDGYIIVHGGAGYPGLIYEINGIIGQTDSIFYNLCDGFYIITANLPFSSCGTGGFAGLQSSSCYCDTTYQSCNKVCEGNTTTFTAPLNSGSTYQWIVSGAVSYSTNNNVATVTWADDSINGGYGTIKYIETYTNGNKDSLETCYVIGDAPDINFTTAPASAGGVVNICSGTNVSFVNQTTGASSHNWDFGNGNTSTQSSPDFTFNQTGSFWVHYTATNDCYCTNSDSVLINVSHAPGPDIQCASVVCANDTGTYNTSMVCATYNWTVTGGTILSPLPYTSAIVIAWGNGSTGNGTVTLDVGTCTGLCATPTTISIPIVSPSAIVSGDDLVCAGDLKIYSVPNIPGIVFNWTVQGGTIASGQGTNSILVNWAGVSGTYNVTVNYNFSLLGCSGTGTLPVVVARELYINNVPKICLDANTIALSAVLPGYSGNYSWIITDPAGNATTFTNTSPLNYTFSNAGTYSVAAAPIVATQACNDTATSSFVVSEVLKPTAISGKTEICPGSTYEYEAAGLTGNYDFIWIAIGGTLSSTEGEKVSVTWNSTGPYALSVKQKQLLTPFCESDTISISITPYILQNITGPLTACPNGQSSYALLGITHTDIYYQWTVTTNAGSIFTGQGEPAIQIEWLNTTGIANVTVTAINCNNQSVALNNIVLTTVPVPVITPANPSFCENASITINASTAVQYLWIDSTGTTISTQQNPSITYGGYFTLSTIDNNGCRAKTSVYVNENPAPEASISTPGSTVFCIPAPVTGTLYALTATGYNYQWFLNGNAIAGTNNPIYNVSQSGNYHTVVTNSFGCTKQSNTKTYSQITCGGSGTCVVADSMDFTFSTCDPIQFTGAVTANVTGATYSFDDPLSGNNSASGLNATHDFSTAGYYHVVFSGLAPNLTPPPPTCPVGKVHLVIVYANADFKVIENCAGTPTLFTDLSTYLPGFAITSWQWNFGDASAPSNQQSPNHIYANGGTYTVTLTITTSVCTIIKTKQIVVPGINANFNYLPNPVCTGTPVAFTDISSVQNPIISWLWNFGDGTSSLNQNPNKTFSTSGNKTVTLQLTDAGGCTNAFNTIINVNAQPATGVISPPGSVSICGNATVALTAPVGNAWSWSSGETTQIINVNSSGDYIVEITTANNCVYVTPSVNINITPLPKAVITSGDDKICLGQSTYLQAFIKPLQTYQWINVASGNVVGTNVSILVTPPSVGAHSYYLVATSTTGSCTDTSDVFTVNVNSYPTTPLLTTIAPGGLCSGNDVTISIANPVSPLSYTWSNGNTSIYNGGSIPSIIVNLAITYNVIATNSAGCSKTSANVVVNPQPDFSTVLSGCYEFCDTTNVVLNAPTGYANYTWIKFVNGNWITVSTNPNYQLTSSGVYSLVLTTFNGCTDTSEVLVVNQYHCCNMHAITQGSLLNCYGENNGTVTVTSPTGAGINYLWSTGQTTASVSGLANGTYFVTVTASPSCVDIGSVLIQSPSQMPLPYVLNVADSMYSSITDSVFNYQWLNYGTPIIGAIGITYNNVDSGCYQILITDVNGCTNISAVSCLFTGIENNLSQQNMFIVFPNPFTNEIFISSKRKDEMQFDLYDLHGRIIFSKKFSGDLKLNLSNISPAIYFYMISGKAEIFKRGKLVKE